MNKGTILTIGAHNDDSLIGAGGTLAKYAKEGKDIISLVVSYGEQSLPQLKKRFSISTRVKESRAADKILGIRRTLYLGIEEGRFLEKKEDIIKVIRNLIKKERPAKIFSHSIDDAHPDHRAVNVIVNEALDSVRFKGELYTYQIWNLLALRKRNSMQMIVNITEEFKIKTKAFNQHKSQKLTILTLMWNVYMQAIINGLKNRMRYAEVFYRER